MEDIYEDYCERLRQYQYEENNLDTCITTLNKLKEQKLDTSDFDTITGVINILKEQKADVAKKYNSTAKAMYEIADCIAEFMDPNAGADASYIY
jgi:hypothetical protein